MKKEHFGPHSCTFKNVKVLSNSRVKSLGRAFIQQIDRFIVQIFLIQIPVSLYTYEFNQVKWKCQSYPHDLTSQSLALSPLDSSASMETDTLRYCVCRFKCGTSPPSSTLSPTFSAWVTWCHLWAISFLRINVLFGCGVEFGW